MGARQNANNRARKLAAARAASRLAAVQALYQRDMEGTPTAKLLDEFHQHRIGKTIEDVEYADADVAFFDDIVKGVLARTEELDALIAANLAEGWTPERLDKPLRQLLRAATYEMVARIDVRTQTVLNEYADVAEAFYDAAGISFVNGVLNAIGQKVRG